MAWTAPRNWENISNDVVTSSMLNVDVRDNLLVLSTHAHSGADGMGASSMSGLSLAALGTLTFADQETNPDAAGELQRNGNDILWYGSSVVNLTAADASAGTASLRSLGTTAVKAAAGNHTHIPGTPNQLILSYNGVFLNTDTESVVRTGTIAVQGASEALAVCGMAATPDGTGNDYTVRLKYTVGGSTTTIDTVTGIGPPGVPAQHSPQVLPESGTAGLISPTSVATYTIFITIERTSGSSSFNPRAIIYAREVGA